MYGEPIGTDFQKFADYLLQNGVVVLPCKIGDKVYQYRKAATRCSAYDYKPRYEDDSECVGCCTKCDSECVDELYTGTISQIQYGDGWTHVIVKWDNVYDNVGYVVGQTVFLTREEADGYYLAEDCDDDIDYIAEKLKSELISNAQASEKARRKPRKLDVEKPHKNPVLPMRYSRVPIPCDVLYHGRFGDYEYMVVSFGMYPCAYVMVPNRMHDSTDFKGANIDCHGGISFSGIPRPLVDHEDYQDTRWIGWDYAHQGDCFAVPENGGKAWTTEEMVRDCLDVIRQLQALEEKEDLDDKL